MQSIKDRVSPETLAMYECVSRNKHIHTAGVFESNDEDIIHIGFTMNGMEFDGYIAEDTTIVELFLQSDIIEGEESEADMRLYGYCEVKDLLELLNKLPHIDDVLIDMGTGMEMIH